MGSKHPTHGSGTSWQGDGLNVALRTPFQRYPEPDGRVFQRTALFGLRDKPALPHWLDVWEIGRGKVLNIEWTHDGRSELVGFKRGDWEQKVLALGQPLDSGCSTLGILG
jgi:hypothetical protein